MSNGNEPVIIVDQDESGLRAAFLEYGGVRSFYFFSENINVGDFYLAKVSDSRPGEIGWFMDLGDGQHGFLPRNKALPGKKPFTGELRIVQVEKEAWDGKPAQLTEQVQVVGRGIAYLPNGGYVAVSRQIAEPARESLRKMALEWCGDQEGIVIRTIASGMSPDQLFSELEGSRARWKKIENDAKNMDKTGIIIRPFSFIESILNENHNPTFCTIYSNIPLKEKFPADRVKIIYQAHKNLFSMHGLNKEYASATEHSVPLHDGATLAFDYAEALTAIDVNSGSASVGAGWEKFALDINLHAAREIARQLRLREIGGMIVIDFLRLHDSADQEKVLMELEAELSHDPATIKVFGFTEMGLFELTRKRRRSGLKDRVAVR